MNQRSQWPHGARRSRGTRRRAAASVAPVVLALALLGALHCGQPRTPRAPARPASLTGDGRPVVPSRRTAGSLRYEAATPLASSSSRSLVARVTFDDRHLAKIGPPVQGRVASVGVVAGDHVERSAVLATIHAPDVAAATAQVMSTHSAAVLAQANAQRTRLLLQQGAGSLADVQSAEAALLQARAEEARANESLAALGGARGLADYELRSPIAGTVVERTVNVGTEVHVGQDAPLFTVADLSTVWVVADVYEADLPLIHLGDAAAVDVVAYPGRAFEGRITHVGDTLDPQTRAASARIEIANADGTLRPGMFAHVEVRGRAQGSAQVPTSAVLARRDQYFVFVRNADGTYARRLVEPGEQHGQHVAILTGLRPGELVVTEGAILLDAEANSAL